jgi:regulator of replication initiation timing
MTSELWDSYRELESSVSRLRKELSQIRSTQEQVTKLDAESTRRAISEALSWTCRLLESIEDADSNLLLCETSSELEKSTEEGKDATLVILEKVKTSWAESCRNADLALMHAMDLSVDLSNFYGSGVISLEREISQTAHETQESVQKVEEDLENIRTSKTETEKRLSSEREERDAAEEKAASKRSVRAESTAVSLHTICLTSATHICNAGRSYLRCGWSA